MEENRHQLAGTIYNWLFFIPDTATPYKKDNAKILATSCQVGHERRLEFFPVIIILVWDHLTKRSRDLIAQLDVILVDMLECLEQNLS